jgi:isopenicillin-N N-acyltransferase-like protein
MKRVRVSGTPYERGVSYGEQARDEIIECIKVYEVWFGAFAKLSWASACDLGAPYARWLQSAEPLLSEEIRGIADGADLPLAAIVALNFRTEIAYGASGLMDATECTCFGVTREASADGHVYLAENWDWLEDTLPLVVMLETESAAGVQLVTVTEAGMLAKFGCNSAGVGLCVNLLGSDVNRVGASFHTLARRVLESGSALEAVWSVTGSMRAGSGNFVIGSATGEIVDVEYTPVGFGLQFPASGFVAHANHFLQAQPGVRDRLQVLPSMSPATYFRQARVDQLLRTTTASGTVDKARVKEILADHQGAPEGICRHGGQVGTQRVLGRTNVSVVMDLTSGVIDMAHGYACGAAYETVVMPWSTV